MKQINMSDHLIPYLLLIFLFEQIISKQYKIDFSSYWHTNKYKKVLFLI